MIILSNAKLVHEARIEKGAVFATQPRENPTRTIFSYNNFTVNASIYDPVWWSLRRNMVQNMLSSTRLKEFRSVHENAMDTLITRIKSEAQAQDGIVSVLKNAHFAVFCILLAMCFEIEMDEETLEKMDQRFLWAFGSFFRPRRLGFWGSTLPLIPPPLLVFVLRKRLLK